MPDMAAYYLSQISTDWGKRKAAAYLRILLDAERQQDQGLQRPQGEYPISMTEARGPEKMRLLDSFICLTEEQEGL